jgi:hypothetical protein
MKNRIAILTLVLALLQFHGMATAQKMDAPKDREPGDRAVFNLTVNGKTQVMEENWVALTDETMVGKHKFGGKEYDVVLSRSPDYRILKLASFTSGQQVEFSPGMQYVNFPLEKGKKWTTAMTVRGETFTTEMSTDRVVERIETIRVPAGEFETFKIAFSGKYHGKDSKGSQYSGREEGANWVSLVSGKMITVKTEFKNSSGEKLLLELISSSFK